MTAWTTYSAAGAVVLDGERVLMVRQRRAYGVHWELPGGFDYTGAQFDGWARAAGFERTEVRHLAGPSSAAIAYKA